MSQPTLEELREQVERRRLQLEAKALQMQEGWFDSWVDPREMLYDQPGEDWFPIGFGEFVPPHLDNRDRGEALPIYVTEQGLKLLRDRSRVLLAENEFAINASENRVSYIVGKGFQYKICRIRKTEAKPEDDPLCQAAQRVIDAFVAAVGLGELEQEVVMRADRDGECFLRLFVDEGGVTVRTVDPEHVRQPPNAHGDQATFGVETAPGDVETVVAYHVVADPLNDPSTTERVPADEMVHLKLNVTRKAKRGVPTFHPIRKNLERAEKLLRNMSVLGQVQATFALIRKHKGQGKSVVDAFRRGEADVQTRDPIAGRDRFAKRYAPGTILDASDNTEYEFPAAAVNAAQFVQILQAELRAAASRLVMPEFMFTSDASNNNYASAMVAEAPSTRNFARLQALFARHLGDGAYGGGRRAGLLWRVLQVAVDYGLIPAEVLTELKIQAEGPSLVARERDKETNRAKTLRDAGILSDATWAKWEELDYDQEQRQGAKRDQPQAPPGGGAKGPPAPGPEDDVPEDDVPEDDADAPWYEGDDSRGDDADPPAVTPARRKGALRRLWEAFRGLFSLGENVVDDDDNVHDDDGLFTSKGGGGSGKGGKKGGKSDTPKEDAAKAAAKQQREKEVKQANGYRAAVAGHVGGKSAEEATGQIAHAWAMFKTNGLSLEGNEHRGALGEAAYVAALGGEFRSHQGGGFDCHLSPEQVGVDIPGPIRVEIKTSIRGMVYAERAGQAGKKVAEFRKHGGPCFYLVSVSGDDKKGRNGTYLQWGFDPAGNKSANHRFAEAGRVVANPKDAYAKMDGSGTSLPLVKVSDLNLESLQKATPEQLNALRERLGEALKPLEDEKLMAKFQAHVEKQADEVGELAVGEVMADHSDVAGRAVFKHRLSDSDYRADVQADLQDRGVDDAKFERRYGVSRDDARRLMAKK